jgi:hypothetical protein
MKMVEMYIAMVVGVLLGGVIVPLILNWFVGR